MVAAIADEPEKPRFLDMLRHAEDEDAVRERRQELYDIARKRNQQEIAEQEKLKALSDEGIKWLQERWGEDGPECPYCFHNFWYVAVPVVLATVPEGSLYPMFPVVCTNCGHTTFVSAVKSGTVDISKDAESNE